MESRREKEAEFRKNHIAEAAYHLFCSSYYESVTVDQIARESQFAKGTLYQYFTSKEEILAYILLKAMQDLTGEIQTRCVDAESSRDAVRSYLELKHTYYQRYLRLFLALLRRYQDGKLPEDFFTPIRGQHRGHMVLLASILEKAMWDGVLAPWNPAHLAWGIDNMIKGFSIGDLERGSAGSAAGSVPDFDLICHLVLNGSINDPANSNTP